MVDITPLRKPVSDSSSKGSVSAFSLNATKPASAATSDAGSMHTASNVVNKPPGAGSKHTLTPTLTSNVHDPLSNHIVHTVEIKAYVDDVELLAKRIQSLGARGPVERMQHDTFFECASGRLKLRCSGKYNELIYYKRDNEYGPKSALYQYTSAKNPALLRHSLSGAFGEMGRVRKYRRSYQLDNATIHLDKVASLGDFVEIKVEIPSHQSPDHSSDNYPPDHIEAGVRAVEDLMTTLNIDLFQLVDGAYIDLICERAGLSSNAQESQHY